MLTKLWERVGREKENRGRREEKEEEEAKRHTVHVLNKAFHSHRQETKHLNTQRPNQ